MDAIHRFAEHVVATSFDDLALEAVTATKTFVLDTLGVAVAGSGEASAAQLGRTASAWGPWSSIRSSATPPTRSRATPTSRSSGAT